MNPGIRFVTGSLKTPTETKAWRHKAVLLPARLLVLPCLSSMCLSGRPLSGIILTAMLVFCIGSEDLCGQPTEMADNGVTDNGVTDNGVTDNGVTDNGVAGNSGAIDAGKEAFRRSARYPWYDNDTDQVHRAAVKPQEDIAGHRKSLWLREKSSFNWNFNWFQGGSQVVAGIVYTLLFALLIALIVVVVRMAAQSYRPPATQTLNQTQGFDTARVSELPVHLDAGSVDLLPLAAKLREEGRYTEAIIYLYSYQLLHLDQNRRIRLEKGKTNRQYLGELRSIQALRQLVYTSMVAFEDVFFGESSLDSEQFDVCWNSLDRFHRLSQQEVAV
jgi:hypothetical protein